VKKILLFLSFALCGCAPVPERSHTPTADTEFRQLADEYLAGFLAWRPQTGTGLGFHQYDGKITDFSKASVYSELARLRAMDNRLDQFQPAGLSKVGLSDYRILRNAIKREIFSFEEMKLYWENPMTYAGALDVNIYIKRNFAPLRERVRSLTAILRKAPDIMAAARENLVESLPRPHIETAIEQANGAADFLGKDLVEALGEFKEETLLGEFRTANTRAIDELRGYAKYLKETKLPMANDHYALGRDRYIKLLDYGEMVVLPPERLLDLGMEELKRKQKVFEETAKQIDPARKAIDVFKEIQKDHPTAQNLIPDTAKDLEMIRQFVLDHKIITIPSNVRAHVAETPQFMRATSFASMDTPGPFETKATEAFYYVTPVESNWPAAQQDEWLTAFNYYTTDIVSIHEAYPGHYIQFLCLNASRATKLEKIFNSYAFTEGWAHYTEQMMVDEGFGKDSTGKDGSRGAKYLLAQTDEALLRICRLCVSIRMHCQNMSVDEATKFFQENAYYEEKPARQEAIRGTFDPEYLYYTLGKLQIFKLREDYRQQEGAKFSLRKFHDEMLRHGSPPIRLLREVLLQNEGIWPDVL
jgi:uncharacterized protein (DUF885 family)